MSLDKIQEIFVNSGVEINDALATGKLTNVKVNDKTSTWRLCLQFSEIVEPDDLYNMQEKVAKYIRENFGIKNVKFTVDYDDSTKSTYYAKSSFVKKYLLEAIEVCKEVKKGVIILNEYSLNLNDNQIEFIVATDEESKTVEENLIVIKKFFLNYGLDFIKFKITIDENAKNIKELSEEKQKIKEDLDETKSAEEYKMRKQLQQENKIQGSYQYKNSGQYIKVKIDDIPY